MNAWFNLYTVIFFINCKYFVLRIDYTIKSRFILPILSLTHSAKSLSLKNKSLEYKKDSFM